MKWELFHAVNDGGASAAVRVEIEGRGLLRRFRYRNVFYPEVEADFRARGGAQTPAIWDGDTLISGIDAIRDALSRLSKQESS